MLAVVLTTLEIISSLTFSFVPLVASDFKFQNEIWKANLVPEEFYSIFYAIYKYYKFSNIDNL